jgi:threonine dehydratase
MKAPTVQEIHRAHERIRPHIHRTPVLTSAYFNERLGAELFFKAENFQKVGAFKIRGATNAVFSLTEQELARGVTTHSSGNHAQALALAARLRGARAVIVMPETAPQVKLAAVRGYGAEVRLCAPTLAAREETTARVMAETGAVLIHPFDDPRIIAGQATAAVELLEEVPDLDVLIAPVGGGGLMSGSCLATRALSPRTRLFAGEPAGADDAYRSFETGSLQPSAAPKTIADGLLTSLSELTYGILRQHLEGVLLASEEGIVEAMRRVWERMKIVIEPSAAVPLAALLSAPQPWAGRRIGVILSGGNVDLERLPWLSPTNPRREGEDS